MALAYEAAERLELLKQQQPQIVAEEVAEPELDENGEEKPPRPDPIETHARKCAGLMAVW